MENFYPFEDYEEVERTLSDDDIDELLERKRCSIVNKCSNKKNLSDNYDDDLEEYYDMISDFDKD